MGAETPQFGCFTFHKPSIPGTVFISDVSSDGQLNRRRKPHTKSRSGCKQCKTRKIKCDEEQPCHNCTRRNQKCEFSVPPTTPSSVSRHQQPAEKLQTPPLVIPAPLSSPINLEHMRLLHHFRTCTSMTFIMDPELWKQSVITLALQNTFLMHAVFLVTATHLQHLQPHKTGHQLAALEHLSQALPKFRMTLAANSDFTGSHGEALIACSMLLLQYAWTYDSEGWARLIGLYQGLTNIAIKYIESLDINEGSHVTSMFTSMLTYSPRMRIERYFENTQISSDIEDIFSHVLSCHKISDTQVDELTNFTEPPNRLKTILFALKLGQRELEASGLILDIARYLFSWPNLLPSCFINLLKQEDGRAQVILLYYFAAVSKLRPDRFWWMRERGVYMFEAILKNVGDKCPECTDRAKEIYNSNDLESCTDLGSETEDAVETLLNFQECPSQYSKYFKTLQCRKF